MNFYILMFSANIFAHIGSKVIRPPSTLPRQYQFACKSQRGFWLGQFLTKFTQLIRELYRISIMLSLSPETMPLWYRREYETGKGADPTRLGWVD
jgi:hypothetical protein